MKVGVVRSTRTAAAGFRVITPPTATAFVNQPATIRRRTRRPTTILAKPRPPASTLGRMRLLPPRSTSPAWTAEASTLAGSTKSLPLSLERGRRRESDEHFLLWANGKQLPVRQDRNSGRHGSRHWVL